mmetsp:Transcript_37069/g.41323  ORF Transcript_37069/g.41323 Transcript_37069/m.41323 type:complete len:82 (+) Transcript_37069:286-531(+)
MNLGVLLFLFMGIESNRIESIGATPKYFAATKPIQSHCGNGDGKDGSYSNDLTSIVVVVMVVMAVVVEMGIMEFQLSPKRL